MAKQTAKRTAVGSRARQQQLRAEALPEVKRLVDRYGRATITNCLTRLKERDRTLKKMDALKRELAEMERKL